MCEKENYIHVQSDYSKDLRFNLIQENHHSKQLTISAYVYMICIMVFLTLQVINLGLHLSFTLSISENSDSTNSSLYTLAY